MPERVWGALLAGAVLVSGGEALAGGSTAARMYDEGVAATDRGDHAEAARAFARADEVSPNPVALGAALDAVIAADDPALGMELVQRADDRAVEGALAAAADSARSKFKDRAGRLRIACAGCEAKVDGVALLPNQTRWLKTGFHLVGFWKDGAEVEQRVVKLGSDRTMKVSPREEEAAKEEEPKAAAEESKTASPGGIGREWFWASLSLTGALALGSVASGVDTIHRHSEFVAHPSEVTARSGQAADSRTQALIGTTAAFAVGTAALGIFGVKWGDSKAPVTASAAPLPGGIAASVGGHF